MGINAFFTFTIILGKRVPWQTALGMVVWAGVLFVLVSATPLRAAIAQAIPRSLRAAAAAGIGMFLTFIGLKNAGIIVSDPATLVKLGTLDVKTLLCVGGIAITVVMMQRRSPLAFLAGIFAVTAAAAGLGLIATPKQVLSGAAPSRSSPVSLR
jgi:AGZA family xanthine/uracil permease-like MFS transporter